MSNIFAVDINFDIGLFAQVNWCLWILAHCEAQHLTPYIKLTSKLYAVRPGADWFDSYFDNLALTTADRTAIHNDQVPIHHVHDINELRLDQAIRASITLAQANQLFHRYLRFKPEISDYVDAFVASNFTNHHVLGIHYRGTDKKIEAIPVPRQRYIAAIDWYAQQHPALDALFVSSDEAAFVTFIQEQYPQLTVIAHNDQQRSVDGQTVHHHSWSNQYQKGWEAIINCLLLSRCSALIKSASFLSAWSAVFNPTMPVALLNKMFDHRTYFPDRELMKRSFLPVAADSD